MSSRTILVDTEPDGSFAYERPCFAAVLGAVARIGDLETPDILVTDVDTGTVIVSWTGLTEDAFAITAQEGIPYSICYGTIRVEVTGGGDTKHGSVRLLLWGS